MLPAGITSVLWSRLAMLLLEDVNWTVMSLIAFEGRPASSTTSTLTLPTSDLGRNSEGEVNTLSFDGKPLGVTVVIGADCGAPSPWAWAVIIAVPGVGVVVTLAMAYSWPGPIITLSGTLAMLICDELRNTTIWVSAADGSPDLSARDTTTAA